MTQTLKFSIDINAERSQIWKALWNDTYYQQWVGVFFKGSYYRIDDWQEGSTIMFLGPDQSGIYSKIEKHKLNEFIHFKHIASVVNGEKQAVDEEAKKWTGANEIYSVEEKANGYTLHVKIDVLEEHVDFMKEKFPDALEIIKTNSIGLV